MGQNSVRAEWMFRDDKIQPGHTILFNEEGTISEITDRIFNNTTQLTGLLIPGFINAHCHLELSKLYKAFGEKRGFVDFASKIPSTLPNSNQISMEEADLQMWNQGIQGVGDISNSSNSFSVKKNSKIQYHTFLELLGWAVDPENAENSFQKGLALYEELQSLGLKGSLSPHAPYSTSPKHLELIRNWLIQHRLPGTIHLNESEAEIQLTLDGSGEMNEILATYGKPITTFNGLHQRPTTYILSQLKNVNLMLVHNTYANQEDISAGIAANCSFCFCPNANLYLEGKIPKMHLFRSVKGLIGTDSLASNWGLSILDEIKTIKRHYPDFEDEILLKWATKNGADFFDFEKLGEINVGKAPGLIQLIGESSITEETRLKRII